MGPMSVGPASIGVGAGVTAFVFLLLPILVWQSRRYGTVKIRRILGAGAVAVYGAALAAYTLLPAAPITGNMAAWCTAYGYDGVNLNVAQFIDDLRVGTQGMTLTTALTSAVVLQLVLNVVLFVPWGVLTRGYLGWSRWASIGSAFACSLLIETTQATGAFGLIPCSYRYGDVDDLLTNTLGGVIGVLLAPVVLRWMPQGRELARSRGLPRPVTITRRLFGMGIDALTFAMIGTVAGLAYRVLTFAFTGTIPDMGGTGGLLLGGVLPFTVVFAIPPWIGSGASWGQRVAWLEPVWENVPGRPSRGRRLLRAAVPGGLWGLMSVLDMLPGPAGDTGAPAFSLGTVAWLVAATAIVSVVATKDRRGLSGVVSGCRYADERRAPLTTTEHP